ncbi:MAG TPA: hypothetical protein VHO06_19175 [Polyangia bacterium]|nr:hypothetical protein [Polyangia bacterium]
MDDGRLDAIADPDQPDLVRKRRWRGWLRALFVAPVLAFALSASSHLEVRCALTGILVPDCCPGAEQPLAQLQQHASISERDCCERAVVATTKLPAASPETGLKGPSLAVGRLPPALLEEAAPSLGARDVRIDSGSFASFSPPYLFTHALLI